MLLIGYAKTSLKAHMLHQFIELDMIIFYARNLFVAIGDR
jgi:hypothetical protein